MNQEDLYRIMHTCSWCGKMVSEDSEVFSVPGKAAAGVDLTDQEGNFIPMKLLLTGKTAYAFVTTSDSPAKREGYDLVFLACSQSCAESLRGALRKEIDISIH
jgi:hypothetical protein